MAYNHLHVPFARKGGIFGNFAWLQSRWKRTERRSHHGSGSFRFHLLLTWWPQSPVCACVCSHRPVQLMVK